MKETCLGGELPRKLQTTAVSIKVKRPFIHRDDGFETRQSSLLFFLFAILAVILHKTCLPLTDHEELANRNVSVT